MFRTLVPRLARCAYETVQPGSVRIHHAVPSRSYCGRWDRNVPVYLRRRNLIEDFFDRRHGDFVWPAWGPGRMLDRWMKQNMKTMDDMMNPRFFDNFFNRYDVVRTGSANLKEVEVKYNDEHYEVKLNVNSYSPDEVSVKLQGEKLVISAKHEEKQDDYGFVSRELSRQFSVPEDVDVESLESVFTNDGYLMIHGKVKGAEPKPEKIINVQKEAPKEDIPKEPEK